MPYDLSNRPHCVSYLRPESRQPARESPAPSRRYPLDSRLGWPPRKEHRVRLTRELSREDTAGASSTIVILDRMLLHPRLATLGFSILIVILVWLPGCVDNRAHPSEGGPLPDQAALDLLAQHQYREAAEVYLQLAEKYKAPLKQDYQLRAADALIGSAGFCQRQTNCAVAEHQGSHARARRLQNESCWEELPWRKTIPSRHWGC